MDDFTLEIDDFEDLVEEAAEEAIGVGVETARQLFAQKIPATRRKTRRNVVHHHRGLRGHVGVRFPPGSRFQKRGTKTKQIIEDVWRNNEITTFNRIKQTITASIEELE